ncbi:DHH family phosphoesterase [Pyrobaculum aerophilum]|uniref:DHH family phosphoesterase n=1 Tax=Pyrobaculum aerophilum TaxID=13773 RepID=UPI0023F49DE6|nr:MULTISPECIES: bifunctional oligoribonuclease/PAP phosphatase NrnA [Pyrobaculum]MCX8137279.1 bifunctional oligoribonuclease/PAP phosphatase NrnA [Pyrobaculum aerophilum]
MLEELKGLLRGVARVAVITHRRADADALACAKILELVIKRLGVNVAAVVCPEGSPLGGCVEEVPKDVDLYVLADVASVSQIPPVCGRCVKIDHHVIGDEIPGIVVNRPSCTEVALMLAEEAGIDIPPDVAKLAVLGIYTDTGRLRRADGETFKRLAVLLNKIGSALGDVVGPEERGREIHVTMALLKGMKRLEVYKSSVGIICTSFVGAHEADLANLLQSVGCRVAIVASLKKDGVHLVFRSRDLNVAMLAASLGAGGGHREAAVTIIKERVSKSQLPSLLRKVVKTLFPDARPLV